MGFFQNVQKKPCNICIYAINVKASSAHCSQPSAEKIKLIHYFYRCALKKPVLIKPSVSIWHERVLSFMNARGMHHHTLFKSKPFHIHTHKVWRRRSFNIQPGGTVNTHQSTTCRAWQSPWKHFGMFLLKSKK